MSFAAEHLITRVPVFNRNREIVFQRLTMADAVPDAVMPFMLRLVNIEAPQGIYFVPLGWLQDAVLFYKRNYCVIPVAAGEDDTETATRAKEAGYRIAIEQSAPASLMVDFRFVPLDSGTPLTPDSIVHGIANPQQFQSALAGPGIHFCAGAAVTAPAATVSKRINPAHTLILELMSAVQQEAEAKDIELMFKRDIALSFKLLRYINSPGFGLTSRIDSIRHALSILGYQQLLKWLTLLAATAGTTASPALTQTAIIRARLMELLGAVKRLEKRDTDNLFMTGMLSMLDRIIGLPLPDILANANLPPSIHDTLLHGSGKYLRFLQLAQACEGAPLTDADSLADIDVKTVNSAHLDAVEWATGIAREAA